jgi:hypothetical protein
MPLQFRDSDNETKTAMTMEYPFLVGSVVARYEGIPGVSLPAVPASLASCSGQLISDAASPFNGKRLPNLNGQTVNLTLNFTANAGGATTTVNAADVAAIALHDWVTGSGIAALTYVKSFNYSTGALVISDPLASGSIPTTFSNEGRSIVGGTTFGSVGDQMQGHKFDWDARTNTGSFVNDVNTRKWFVNTNEGTLHNNQPKIITDGTNGTPRIGAKTKADAYRMTYYMRIK